METDTHVLFHSHKPNDLGIHVFSQWFPSKFNETFEKTNLEELKMVQEATGFSTDVIVIMLYNCEQYMMLHKALLFHDIESIRKIIPATTTSNPAVIKKLGREIKGFDQTIWDLHKFEIVVQGNRLKFQQNPNLMMRLVGTGKKIIVEASPDDNVWGIGLSAEKAITIPEDKWPGQNLLGKALMYVRDK